MNAQAAAPARSAAGGLANAGTILEVRNLRKYFPVTEGFVFQKSVGDVKAVDGVSFDIRKGETLGLV